MSEPRDVEVMQAEKVPFCNGLTLDDMISAHRFIQSFVQMAEGTEMADSEVHIQMRKVIQVMKKAIDQAANDYVALMHPDALFGGIVAQKEDSFTWRRPASLSIADWRVHGE